MKNLRVAVVSVDDDMIDQSSSIDEILGSPLLNLYPLTDFFKAMNDEDVDSNGVWTFLLDIEKRVDLTGTNIDGIHFHQKAIDIAYIKKVLNEWGEVTACDLELDHSPCLNSIGNGKVNVSELVEEFRPNGVSTVTYQDQLDLGYSDYHYEELNDDIIAEIRVIMENYEADCLKTEKRCAD